MGGEKETSANVLIFFPKQSLGVGNNWKNEREGEKEEGKVIHNSQYIPNVSRKLLVASTLALVYFNKGTSLIIFLPHFSNKFASCREAQSGSHSLFSLTLSSSV